MFGNKFTTYPTNMEAKNLGCSLKNIPIPTKQHYLKSMADKVESFITRLRWKACKKKFALWIWFIFLQIDNC